MNQKVNSGKMSVLISDSDKMIRENLTEYLSVLGYEAAEVESQQELLNAQILQSVKLVLLECSGDDNDVLETIQKIYQLNPSIVVMVMMIEPTIKRLLKFIENNVFDILIKPLSLNDLKDDVEKALLRFHENSEFRVFQKNKELILHSLAKQGVDIFQHQDVFEATSREV